MRERKPLEERSCLHCGTAFATRYSKKIYCSNRCRVEFSKRARAFGAQLLTQK